MCEWGHRMTNTRDHVEIEELRRVLKLDTATKEGKQEDNGNGNETSAVTEAAKDEVNNTVETPASQQVSVQ